MNLDWWIACNPVGLMLQQRTQHTYTVSNIIIFGNEEDEETNWAWDLGPCAFFTFTRCPSDREWQKESLAVREREKRGKRKTRHSRNTNVRQYKRSLVSLLLSSFNYFIFSFNFRMEPVRRFDWKSMRKICFQRNNGNHRKKEKKKTSNEQHLQFCIRTRNSPCSIWLIISNRKKERSIRNRLYTQYSKYSHQTNPNSN